jgi:PEGA domain-containing protein
MSNLAPRRTPDHLRVDPASLAGTGAPAQGAALRRLVVFALCGVAALALGGYVLQAALSRARGATAAAARALPPLAVEGDATAEPARPAQRIATPRELAELHRSWVGSETIAPRDPVRDAATGEVVGAFQGFGVDVATTPAGARIVVDGRELGISPLLASVRCTPGASVEVRAERGGREARATTRCREDALVRLHLRLRSAAAR